MSGHCSNLKRLIETYTLDWRHPKELEAPMKLLDLDRMRPGLAKKYLRIIQPWIKEQIEKGNYLPKPPLGEDLGLDVKPFDVELGYLEERPEVPFGLHLSDGVHHTIIVGRPGSGKTVTLKVYLAGVCEYNAREPDHEVLFLYLDSKRDIPNPEKVFGGNCLHLSVHHPELLRFGLNPPANVPIQVWAATTAQILAARLNLIIARSVLVTAYKWVVPILNPSAAEELVAPSARLILDILTNSPVGCWAQKPDYAKTLIQRLHEMLTDAGDLFEAERGFDVNSDVFAKGKHCVIDMADFNPPYLRYVIADMILMQILAYRMHNHLKSTRTRICVVIDEADLFVQPSAQMAYPQGLSAITLWARLGREYGIQFVVVVSGLQNVAPYLLSGASNIIALNSVDAESIWRIRDTLGLERGTERMLPTLEQGQCIWRDAQSQYPHPALARVRFIEPDHSDKQGSYDFINFKPARGLDELPSVQQALEARTAEYNRARTRQFASGRSTQGLNKTQRSFLDHMSLSEFDTLDVVFSKMGRVPAGTQKKIVAGLQARGLIDAKTVRSERSWARFGLITEAGWKYLNKKSAYSPLRGGTVHTCLCRLKQRLYLQIGFESHCERQLSGCRGVTDIVSIKDKKIYATEVVVECDSNIVKHVRDCFLNCGQKVRQLTIVTLLKSQHAKIRETIMSDPELVFFIDRIEFVTAEAILRELYR